MPAPPRPRSTSGRPRGADSTQRRAAILDAAEALFSEQGYRGVSMSAVARAAGISGTGLVHHFATKDDLLQAVMDRRDERDSAQFQLNAGKTGWAFVAALKDLARHNEGQESMVRLYASVAGEAVTPGHPASRWLREHYAHTRTLLASAVREAVAAGELRADAPAETIARLLLAAMDGLQLQWLADDAYPSMAEDFAELVDSLHARWAA
ncbi:TetR/AcrR family transcriptional regulator [Zhihengliuella alba]|uniref:TetR/AcrR family transcriptional regulator n=1 Tax=Zhihengliuella alba TaxID=547018 RepID=A0ABP7E0R6_9MICC